LVDTGDEIHSIEAVLSGTLSFIFNNLKSSFAEQVREAMRLGFTEPDPRDDLSGQDVLRKMTILTREMGHNYEGAVPENLVPASLQNVSRDEFIARLDEIKISVPQNQILRYVASWEQNGIRVGLKSFAPDHPMAFLKYADNILIIRSARYNHQPLIVQGPGAGPAVTAGGVFADVLRLVRSLGASL
jgi:aspartokinase/homoserine dehydrogenase 1